MVDRAAVREPQRRRAALRAGPAALHRHGRRRLGWRPRQPRAGHAAAARQDPAHRRRRRRAVRHSAGQSVRRRPRRARGDLRHRRAQSVATFVRSRDRRPLHRATSARIRGRRSTACPPAPAPAPTSAGAAMEGLHCTGSSSPVPCNDPSLVAADPRVLACRRLLDHRRIRVSRHGGAGAGGPLRVRRLLRGFIRSAAVVPGSRPSTRTLAPPGATSARSARTSPASSTSPTRAAARCRGSWPKATTSSTRSSTTTPRSTTTSSPASRPRSTRSTRHALRGWQRTGERFGAYADARPGFDPVCRFYIPPALGDSHFVSASAAECADVRARFPAFVEETPTRLAVALPDLCDRRLSGRDDARCIASGTPAPTPTTDT